MKPSHVKHSCKNNNKSCAIFPRNPYSIELELWLIVWMLQLKLSWHPSHLWFITCNITFVSRMREKPRVWKTKAKAAEGMTKVFTLHLTLVLVALCALFASTAFECTKHSELVRFYAVMSCSAIHRSNARVNKHRGAFRGRVECSQHAPHDFHRNILTLARAGFCLLSR